jgi:hypothetical protein
MIIQLSPEYIANQSRKSSFCLAPLIDFSETFNDARHKFDRLTRNVI